MSNEWSKHTFAVNLKRQIELSGKKQKEIAEIIGVSAPTLNEWLNEKKYPRIDKIQKLADYFGILKSDLIEDKSINLSVAERKRCEFENWMQKEATHEDLAYLIGVYATSLDTDEKMKLLKTLVDEINK